METAPLLPIKCLSCDSKSFAIHLPKDLDEDYKESFDQEERETRFPKLFKDPLDTGEYYHCVLVTCAKCGDSLADERADQRDYSWSRLVGRSPSAASNIGGFGGGHAEGED